MTGMDRKIKSLSKNLRYIGMTSGPNSSNFLKEKSYISSGSKRDPRSNSRGAVGAAYEVHQIPTHIMETKAILPKNKGQNPT
jgi:hypothetical protein